MNKPKSSANRFLSKFFSSYEFLIYLCVLCFAYRFIFVSIFPASTALYLFWLCVAVKAPANIVTLIKRTLAIEKLEGLQQSA